MSTSHYYTIDETEPSKQLKIYVHYIKDTVSMGSMQTRKRGLYLSIRTVQREGFFERTGIFHDISRNNIQNGAIFLEELARKSQKKFDSMEERIDFDWVAKQWLSRNESAVLDYLKDFKKPEEVVVSAVSTDPYAKMEVGEAEFFQHCDFSDVGGKSDYSFEYLGEVFKFNIEEFLKSQHGEKVFISDVIDGYGAIDSSSWIASMDRSTAFYKYLIKSILPEFEKAVSLKRGNVVSLSAASPENEDGLYYFIHPESGCAWIQDHESEYTDGLTEEITKENFDELSADEYSIDRVIHTKDEVSQDVPLEPVSLEPVAPIEVAPVPATPEKEGRQLIAITDQTSGVKHIAKLYKAYMKNNPGKSYENFVKKLVSVKDAIFSFSDEVPFASLLQKIDTSVSPIPFKMEGYAYGRDIVLSSVEDASAKLLDLYSAAEAEFPVFKKWVEKNAIKIFSPDTKLGLLEKGMESAYMANSRNENPFSKPNPYMEEFGDQGVATSVKTTNA